MTDRDALLRAIRAAPDDDTSRLVYADWLDDRGEDAEAEFVRLQVELEPVRHRLEDRRTRELIRREEVIEAQEWDRRFGAAFEFDHGLTHPEGVGFRRGLPDWLYLSLDTLLAQGDRLFAAYPTVRELAFYNVQDRGGELAACPLVAKVDTLEIADFLVDEDAAALAASPHLRPVRRFRLYTDWNGHEFAARLARQNAPDWPGRFELVWLTDGLAGGLTAAECDQPLSGDETFAIAVNAEAGREIAFDIRPATRRFPLRGYAFDSSGDDADLELGVDTAHGMYVGRLPDGRQALAAWGPDDWTLVTFDEAGLVTGIDRRPCPVPGIAQQAGPEWLAHAGRVEAAARHWATGELGLTPAVIRVREFDAGGRLGVHLWPQSYVDELTDGSVEGDIGRWLRDGDFVIDWGNDFWADWTGTIHSS